MSPTPFGDSPAAIVLYRESIKLAPSVRRRLGRFLSRYGRLLNAVKTKDVETATLLYDLILRETLMQVGFSVHFIEVDSYLRNVLTTQRRIKMRALK